MKVFILTTPDYNEADCGCYMESVRDVFSTKEAAMDYVKKIGLREFHYSISEWTVAD